MMKAWKGTGKMVFCVKKHTLYKCEDLSSNPRNPCKGTVTRLLSQCSCCRLEIEADSPQLQAGQPVWSMQWQDPVSNRVGGEEQHPGLSSGLHTYSVTRGSSCTHKLSVNIYYSHSYRVHIFINLYKLIH